MSNSQKNYNFIKRGSVLFIIKQMQIRTTVYFFQLPDWQTFKKSLIIPDTDEYVETIILINCWWTYKLIQHCLFFSRLFHLVKPKLHNSNSLCPPSPSPWQPPFFVFMNLTTSYSSYQWNHTIIALLWLTYFT